MKDFFRKYLVAGAVVVLPVAGTIWILKTLVLWMDNIAREFIPHALQPEELFGIYIPGVGIFLTIFLLLLVGMFARLYMGKKIIALGDRFLNKIPFGKGIYSLNKQLMNAMMGKNRGAFQRAVLVEYPKKGTYALGFLTSDCSGEIQEKTTSFLVNVFVPTTPNPTSGFLLMVPKEEIIPLQMGIDEAFKLLISGGMVNKSE